MTNVMFGIDRQFLWWLSFLVPFQDTGMIGGGVSRGIGRQRLPQPWAMFFRPVGPMEFPARLMHCPASLIHNSGWPMECLVRLMEYLVQLVECPARLDNRCAPNWGQDHSPGLSIAMPWDKRSPSILRPEGARDSADLKLTTPAIPFQGRAPWALIAGVEPLELLAKTRYAVRHLTPDLMLSAGACNINYCHQ